MVNLIWATRGRMWGFRFLLSGGFSDPLPHYELAFRALRDEMAGFQRSGDLVALRFPDPLNRKDDAGRVIPHDFVVMAPLADSVESVDDGLEQIWPLVAERYAVIWDRAKPPSTDEVLIRP